MSWITPTTADVTSEFTERELAVIQNVQGAIASNLSAILSRVVDEARDNIRSGGTTLDDTTTTIPRGLVNDVIAIARWRLLISMPQFKALQSEARKDEYDRAIKKMEAIAVGKFKVEPIAGGSVGTGLIEEVQAGNSGNSREELTRL
jgi:phage gp36-like protein